WARRDATGHRPCPQPFDDRGGRRPDGEERPGPGPASTGQEAAAAAGALEEPLAAASAEEPESAGAAPESADASDSTEDSALLDPDGVELPVVAESVE